MMSSPLRDAVNVADVPAASQYSFIAAPKHNGVEADNTVRIVFCDKYRLLRGETRRLEEVRYLVTHD